MADLLHNGKLIIDIDGTLCPVKKPIETYEELTPDQGMLRRIHDFKALGYEIAFSTSRNMRTHGGNLGRINATTAPALLDWLRKWGVPFDELYFGKPWPGETGFYVDDRAIRPREFRDLSNVEIFHLLEQSSIGRD